jgi:hypothetical protein
MTTDAGEKNKHRFEIIFFSIFHKIWLREIAHLFQETTKLFTWWNISITYLLKI